MTITSYKRLTIVLIGVIGVLLVLVLNLYRNSWTWKNRELNTWLAVSENTRTRDYVIRSNADTNTAAMMLYSIYCLPAHKFTDGPLDWVIQQNRESCASDIIEYLKKKTGQDLGDNPTNWIQKYAPGILQN